MPANLFPDDDYLLTCCMEECGEIIQAASKCIRHGVRSHHPDRPNQDNGFEFMKEVVDLVAVLQMIGLDVRLGVIHDGQTQQLIEKKDRIRMYMEKNNEQ